MYSILLVSADSGFRSLAGKFIPRIDKSMELHTASGIDTAMAVLGGDTVFDIIVFDHHGDNDIGRMMDLMDRSRVRMPIVAVSADADAGALADMLNSGVARFVPRGGRDPTEFFTELCRTVVIVVERGRTLEDRHRNESALSALVEMMRMPREDFDAILGHALDKAVEVTGSTIGYVAALSRETNSLRMLAWSAGAMRGCSINKYPIDYDLSSAGIWAEPVRLEKSMIINDYSLSTYDSLKKGTPTGHVKIEKLLMIPIFHGKELVGTAGVGNKQRDYTWADEKLLGTLMEGLFDIYAARASVSGQHAVSEALGAILGNDSTGFAYLDSDQRVVFMNPLAETVLGEPEGLPMPLDKFKSSNARDVTSLINEVKKHGGEHMMVLRTADREERIFEARADIVTGGDGRTGFLVVFVDVTLYRQISTDMVRTGEHISVLEDTVLNNMAGSLMELKLQPYMSRASPAFQRLDKCVIFMGDYRSVGIHGTSWIDVKDAVERGASAVNLGGLDLVVKAEGIRVLADTSFPLVFKHLLQNTVIHGVGATTVDIRCRISKGFLTIVYTDDGIGIPAGVRDNHASLPAEGKFGLFLIENICALSNMSMALPSSEAGALVEIFVPPSGYSMD